MPKFVKLLAVLVAVPLVVAGCKITSINYFPPHPANVRVANVIPNAGALNIAVAGTPAFSGLTFETLTGYQSYDNTTTTFTVTVAGAATPLLTSTYALAGEQSYTLVTFGALNAPQTLMLQDTSVSPGSGKFQLVVANVAIGIGAVDVYLYPPGTDISGVTPTFSNISYGTSGVVGNFAVGNFSLIATPTGTKTLIYDSGPRTYSGNTETDVLMYSRGSAHLVNVAMLDINAGGQSIIANNLLAEFKLVNAAPGVVAINQLQDGLPLISNLAYATGSYYTRVPAGTPTYTFEATATPGATLATLTTKRVAATDQSIFLTGFPGAQTAIALDDNNLPPVNGNVRLRFVNASPDAGPVDVLVNGTKQASSLASPTASAYVELAAGTDTLTFVSSVTGATLKTLSGIVLTSGQTSTVYLIGPAADLSGLVSQDT
jgi:hypothetical protein